jgi:hypothetical protein
MPAIAGTAASKAFRIAAAAVTVATNGLSVSMVSETWRRTPESDRDVLTEGSRTQGVSRSSMTAVIKSVSSSSVSGRVLTDLLTTALDDLGRERKEKQDTKGRGCVAPGLSRVVLRHRRKYSSLISEL